MVEPTTVEFTDSFVGKHFGHHTRFSKRNPGAKWRFRLVRVPLNELHCLYNDPGVSSANPAGLMGAVGESATGHSGRPIAQIAHRIDHGIKLGLADLSNSALKKVLSFRDAGQEVILSAEEPIAVSRGDQWYVREGTHRCIALSLLGVAELVAIDFESAELV